jgi:hypothetical protein
MSRRRLPSTATTLITGGCVVAVQSESLALYRAALAAAGASSLDPPARAREPDLTLMLEASRSPFDVIGWELVTRGVWANGAGEVVMEDVGGSGFTQRWSVRDGHLTVRSRWVPSRLAAVAASGMRARFRTLRGQVLLHYPVLWWASTRGLAPLHVSALAVDDTAVLLAGPGGVGKSTLVAQELAGGGTATCDNLAVSDGITTHGLAEPLRLSDDAALAPAGARSTHGRRESTWSGRVPSLTPELLVVVRRGTGHTPEVRPVDPAYAARALVAGTYGAGELRRFWQVAALVALGTGYGPPTPPVVHIASALAVRLPCYELQVAGRRGVPLNIALQEQLTPLRTQGARP